MKRPHPLPPLVRWGVFPGFALVLAFFTGYVTRMTSPGWVQFQMAAFMGLLAVAGAIGASLWSHIWMNALITPLIGNTLTVAFYALGEEFRSARDWTDLLEGWIYTMGPGCALISGTLGLLHHMYLRRPGKPAIRTAGWMIAYAGLNGLAGWYFEAPGSQFVADFALLGLVQYAAVRIALAWARRPRTDVGTPPGGVAAPSANA